MLRSANALPESRAATCSSRGGPSIRSSIRVADSAPAKTQPHHPPPSCAEAILVGEVALQHVEHPASLADGASDQLGEEDDPRGDLPVLVVERGVVEEEPVPVAEADRAGDLRSPGLQERHAESPPGQERIAEKAEEEVP